MKNKIELISLPQSLKFGMLFGVAMSIFYIMSLGFIGGLIGGLISGLFFGVCGYLFANSKIVKQQIVVEPKYLLPGEEIIKVYGANLVIEPKKFGLKQFAFDDYLWVVGMRDKEALGGAINLTNFRIIFKSHKLNRLRGVTSIFLPTIIESTNTSRFITKKITLETSTTSIDFVVNNIPDLIENILSQKAKLNHESILHIQKSATQYPDKCSDGLNSWNALNVLNNIILIGKKAEKGVELVKNPIGALGSIFLKELLDKTITEKWQKMFDK